MLEFAPICGKLAITFEFNALADALFIAFTKKSSAKSIEITDLPWEFFLTCWKYNREFYEWSNDHYKSSLGVPLYHKLLGKKLFRQGIKYPLWRFAC